MANKLDPIGKSSLGMDENVAAALSYVAGFITGIIFFVMEKDSKFVKFHAMQSIAISVAITVLGFILGIIPIIGWILAFFLPLVSFVLWIILLLKSYQGEWFELPVIGQFSMEQANK
ncbi:DUF4870 domain-containing protein [Anaerotalea alkaliphila]|uniref:DUF4870 domain-containing protein n=1 Tax=Anaerotalea alkaliphila TaxID=2662126 RepID=A0A7X5HX39_9FIRM|nr:DUF4870 domain-containing protein [Anaerotalea alkaliphila]NDL68274.1 DUF4870 domain-containing protein [Anaerotalea alkaliphila]